jgi:hypothetical protein
MDKNIEQSKIQHLIELDKNIQDDLRIKENILKYNDFVIKTIFYLENKILDIEVSNDKSYVKYKSTIDLDNYSGNIDNILNYFNLDNHSLDENPNKKQKYEIKYIDTNGKSYFFDKILPKIFKFSYSYGILTMELIRLNISNTINETIHTEIIEFKISLFEHNIEKELNLEIKNLEDILKLNKNNYDKIIEKRVDNHYSLYKFLKNEVLPRVRDVYRCTHRSRECALKTRLFKDTTILHQLLRQLTDDENLDIPIVV